MHDDWIPSANDRTTVELIASRSLVAASCWRLSEGCRIVGYSIAFIGPWLVAVFWVFDVLKERFSQDELLRNDVKEWYFYVGLAFVMLSVGWLFGRVFERVQASLERRFC